MKKILLFWIVSTMIYWIFLLQLINVGQNQKHGKKKWKMTTIKDVYFVFMENLSQVMQVIIRKMSTVKFLE